MTYSELLTFRSLLYGNGPTGYFTKRFTKSDHSETELIGLLNVIDFSLPGQNQNLSLGEKAKFLKSVINRNGYTNWLPEILAAIVAAVTIIVGNQKWDINSIYLGVEIVVALGVYALTRMVFESRKDSLLDALEHIERVSMGL